MTVVYEAMSGRYIVRRNLEAEYGYNWLEEAVLKADTLKEQWPGDHIDVIDTQHRKEDHV